MGLISILMVLIAIVQLSGRAGPILLRDLVVAQTILWLLFAIEFAIKLALARNKPGHLRQRWIDALIVVFPFVGTPLTGS